MAKKKKKKKAKKARQLQADFNNLGRDRLLRLAENHLANGKPRDAVSALRFAEKRHGRADDISRLMYRAHLMRASDLHKKGMHAEGEAMRRQGAEYVEDFADLSEADLLLFTTVSPDADAFKAYRGYLAKNGRSPGVEQGLADHLFIFNNWDLADLLGPDIPLGKDGAVVREALPLMNAGDWAAAAEALRPLPRKSYFAPVRLFCRAMASFYNGDDRDALKALSMIPGNFPLQQTADDLIVALSKRSNHAEKKQALSRLSFLWDGPPDPEGLVRDIMHAVGHWDVARLSNLIGGFADAVRPETPLAVKRLVLKIILRSMDGDAHDKQYKFLQLVRKVLPRDAENAFLARLELMNLEMPLTSAGHYISNYLKKEFPDPEDQNIARSQILIVNAQGVHAHGADVLHEDGDGLDNYGKVLGIHSRSRSGVIIDMALEAIRLDPENRKLYEILVQFDRPSREDRKKVEGALNRMLKMFPDDPFPCLELATLFYESHAFRKAENILGEAMARAPHDNRVLEKHAVSLLTSADINIRRGKFHLVEKDLERAEALDARKADLFLLEKKLLMRLAAPRSLKKAAKTARASDARADAAPKTVIEKELHDLSPAGQLRVLTLLALDLAGLDIREQKSVRAAIDALADDRLKHSDRLSAQDVVTLLSPPSNEYRSVYANRRTASYVLERSGADLLGRIDDAGILQAYDMIIRPDIFGHMKTDIRKRLKKMKGRNGLKLQFLLIVLEYIDGDNKDPDRFYDIMDETEDDNGLREELRAMARRLAGHAAQPLKKALEQFDFEYLEPSEFGFPVPIFDDDDDDFYDDDDFFFDDMDEDFDDPDALAERLEHMAEVISMAGVDLNPDEKVRSELIESMEDFVDSFELRGFTNKQIISRCRVLENAHPQFSMVRRTLTSLLSMADIERDLSREAKAVLNFKG